MTEQEARDDVRDDARAALTELAPLIPTDYEGGVNAQRYRRLFRVIEGLLTELSHPKHPEPEWEYGIRAEGDDEPWSDHSDDLDWLLDITSDYMGLSDVVVRRRKAGPWEPVS